MPADLVPRRRQISSRRDLVRDLVGVVHEVGEQPVAADVATTERPLASLSLSLSFSTVVGCVAQWWNV